MLNPIVIGGPEGGSARTVPKLATKTASADATERATFPGMIPPDCRRIGF
jgi:hypothetical protein